MLIEISISFEIEPCYFNDILNDESGLALGLGMVMLMLLMAFLFVKHLRQVLMLGNTHLILFIIPAVQ